MIRLDDYRQADGVIRPLDDEHELAAEVERLGRIVSDIRSWHIGARMSGVLPSTWDDFLTETLQTRSDTST